MPKYMASFAKKVYGCKEFEAKNNTEMINKLENFKENRDLDKELDNLRDDGWTFVEYNEVINISNKASHKDICEQARKHYEELSKECSSWSSTIPKMIDFYEKYYPKKL